MIASILILTLFLEHVLLEGEVETSISGQSLEKSTRSTCDVDIREQYGLIRSPGYPGKYPRYARCHYTVHRASQDICEVKLTVERFEVTKMTFSNCSNDFFEIQNGWKRYKLCGELPAGSKKFVFFPDNSDKLVFKFQSAFNQKSGFSVEVKQLPFSCKKPTQPQPTAENTTHESMRSLPPCIQMVGGRIGRITFPDFTEDNLPVEKCTYKIRKSEPRACVVQLDLSSFEVTESAECQADYLLLPTGHRLCGILGGKRKLIQFPEDSDEMSLEFVSHSANGNSFDIQISQLPGPCDYGPTSNRTVSGKAYHQCDKTMSDATGRITSPGFPGHFGPNYKCTYRIFRPDPSVCQIELEYMTFSVGRHNPPGCHSGAYLELPGKNRLCQDLTGIMLLKVSEFRDPVVLQFYSDSQSSGRGFDIRIKQIPNTCPGYNVHPELPNTLKRCYQEVSSYSGYFSSSHMSTPHHLPKWCEFVIRRADPSVCRIYLQLSSRTFITVPCVNNFIQLPNGERMCVSLVERREIWIPKGSDYLTLVYYNTNNADFHLFVDQVRDSCKIQNFQSSKTKKKRWAWVAIPR